MGDFDRAIETDADRSLADAIDMTRRQLMSTVGGLTAGTAATGVVGATYRTGYDEPLDYTDWTCRYGTKSDEKDFREFFLAMSDCRYIVNDDGSCVVPRNPDDDEQNPDAPCNELGNAEDQGYLAFNKRSEPFHRRFETDPRQERGYDSTIHGDPATLVFHANVGDSVKFRISHSSDTSRRIS